MSPQMQAFLRTQDAEDLHACRMPEGLGERGQLFVGLVALDGPTIYLLVRGRAAGILGWRGSFHRSITILRMTASVNPPQKMFAPDDFLRPSALDLVFQARDAKQRE